MHHSSKIQQSRGEISRLIIISEVLIKVRFAILNCYYGFVVAYVFVLLVQFVRIHVFLLFTNEGWLYLLHPI